MNTAAVAMGCRAAVHLSGPTILGMPRRLLLALLALVAAPLALLGWVSATSMRQQRQFAEQQLQSLLTSRLNEINRSLEAVLDDHARSLAVKLNVTDKVSEKLRDLKLSDPLVREGILVSANGVLVYPARPVADDPDDIALYAALRGLINGRPDREPADADESNQDAADARLATAANRAARSPEAATAVGTPQWQVWYMDEGSQLILWVARSDGSTIGVLLERVRWVADMTAALPDSSAVQFASREATPGFTALVDEAQQIVYRWGDEGQCSDPPLAMIRLSPPLSTWQLEYHSPAPIIPPAQSTALYASLAGIGVVLLALGGFVLTSVGRQMRTARNRVSFAGQVSHELRTPLTNIRLYAELAESDLSNLPDGKSREKLAQRLKVIDSESRRLGRLVSGVLEMIRDDRKQRGPKISNVNPDEIIDQTLQQFAPSFASAGIVVHRDAGADRKVDLDADILEMVLVNLLSNVEKYAAGGKRVDVESRLNESALVVSVSDFGPGIPRRKHRAVFRAFSRLDDSVSAPSGTGIGLTIARSAARRHGGDLRLTPSEQGTRFELTLPVTS